MRILLLHARELWFKAVKPALREPPDPPGEASVSDAVVAFISVERGDGAAEAEAAAREVLEHARRVGVGKAVVYPFAHLSSDLAPPGEAVEVLRMVEARLAEELGAGNVVRAPFGWYKAFRVHCAGHPLCELSRTIRGASRLLYAGRPLEEVEGLGDPKPWGQDVAPLLARFQLHPVGEYGDYMSRALAYYLLERAGAQGYRRPAPLQLGAESGPKALAGLLEACTLGGEEPLLVPTEYGDLLVSEGLEPREALEGLFGERAGRVLSTVDVGPGGLEYDRLPRGARGSVVVYKTTKGALVPLGATVDGVSCAGPTLTLAKALVDDGLRAAGEGVTPALPAWLAPVQAAVIPVRERHVDYARGVLERLVWEGVRAYLDPPTRGLGARIRAAARLWTPYIMVVGDREVESGTVTVRRRRGVEQESMPVEAAVEEVLSAVRSGPLTRPLPPPPQHGL